MADKIAHLAVTHPWAAIGAVVVVGLLVRALLPEQRTRRATGLWVFGASAGAAISLWVLHNLAVAVICGIVAFCQGAFGPMGEG